MHANLFIGNDQEILEKRIEEHTDTKISDMYVFEVQKIGDVRELNKKLRLSANKKTTYLFRDIDIATIEAMNALLKILEEPKPNIEYVLTAKTSGNIIPTILSRVNIIKVKPKKSSEENYDLSLLNKTLAEKLIEVDSIKKRADVENFLNDFINSAHNLLVKKNLKINLERLKYCIDEANKCLTAVNRNGNINLHLSKFMILIDRW